MTTLDAPLFRLTVSGALVATALALGGAPADASTSTAPPAAPHSHVTLADAAHGHSRSLRDLPVTHGQQTGHPALTLRSASSPSGQRSENGAHAQVKAPSGDAFTAPQQNFDGMGRSISSFTGGGTPPDENSDVSSTQIVEVVNTSVAVFSKTGSVLAGPVNTGSLFASLGSNPCATRNDGDGVVRYDALAHRWFIAQFAIPTDDGQPGPDYECVAVSATDDATGAYHVYAFADAFGGFPDYGKFGVWPDAYYATFNDFTGDENGFIGDVSCAYDRTAMLAGHAATEQCFNLGSSYFGLLPADLDGPTPPPSGAPNYQVALGSTGDSSALFAWEFHVDWSTPANSTLSRQPDITVPRYAAACEFYRRNQCIPEPSGGQTLESLGDRLMFPLTYRSFGADGMLTVSHSVNAGSTTGERWYQLGVDPENAITLDQQGTYAPADSQYRFMGSITSDHANDLALGFSTSSSSVYPDIRYTGRLASDPAGAMTQTERTIFSGTGFETTYGRWGDYSSMDIDPADDCTFWYTNEYYTPGATYKQWNTRIASFTNPACGTGDFGMSLSSPSGQTSGGTATTTVDTQLSSGSPGTIGLSVSGVPAGASTSLTSSTVSAGHAATLTFHAGTAATGTYRLVVTGQSPAARHSVEYDVTVTNDFSIALDPASGTGPGPLAPSTLSTTLASGTAGTLDLAVSGVPAGATATLGASSIPTGGTTTLTVDPGTAAEGTHPITVTATDTRDHGATHQATYQLTIPDTTAPTVTLHAVQPATIAPSVHLSWTGSDSGSGVASSQVRYRRASATGGFGAWTTPTSWQHLTGSGLTARLDTGRDHCFEVRVTDHAGNASAWSPAACIARALDDRALARSAHWTRKTGSHWWLHTATSSSTRGAKLSLAHAHVDRLGIVASRCPTCGKVGVYVGSHRIGTINLKGHAANKKLILLPRFALRSGTVGLKVLTSGKKVVIDGLVASRT